MNGIVQQLRQLQQERLQQHQRLPLQQQQQQQQQVGCIIFTPGKIGDQLVRVSFYGSDSPDCYVKKVKKV